MVNLVWVRYGPLVSDIYIWKSFFVDFAQHFQAMGAPFDNLIGFLDGKLVPTARPGVAAPSPYVNESSHCES